MPLRSIVHSNLVDKAILAQLHAQLWDRASVLNHRLLVLQMAGHEIGEFDLACSSDFYDHEFAAQRQQGGEAQRVVAELAAACRALELMQRGRYGRCDGCNAAVPVQRLREQPHRLCCVHCEAALRQRLTVPVSAFSPYTARWAQAPAVSAVGAV